MSSSPFPPVDPAVPGLLRLLLQQFQASDEAALQATLATAGARHLAGAHALVGALCLGGADFAARLAACDRDAVPQAQRYEAVLEAFHALVDAPHGAPEGHELRVAEWLIQGFGLQAEAGTLLDTVRAEFLIAAGPLDVVPQAAFAAFKQGQWALALRGFTRCQQTLQDQTPRDVYGMVAMCLHKLARYDEAEHWAAQGLGKQRALLAIGPVHAEADLLRRWAGQRAPVVSILCTTYNHERYIESAIRGFLSQDCSFPFEILIHDDASTDGTQRVIRHWQERYPGIIRTVLQTENQYSRGERPFELLLAQARGGFVATCEGDDFWVDPSKLQRQVGFLQANPEFSCSAHNYHHYVEATLCVSPWSKKRHDQVLSASQLMGLHRLLWLPTLVFRKTFSAMPPERALAPIGDQFLTSYLGTQGACMYFYGLLGAVRRENEFSTWSPLPGLEKERIRVRTWVALVRMHRRLGHRQAVADLMAKISASPLDGPQKAALLGDMSSPQHSSMAAT
jgi:glycosyltransferase involved in cell wall biosynthesis